MSDDNENNGEQNGFDAESGGQESDSQRAAISSGETASGGDALAQADSSFSTPPTSTQPLTPVEPAAAPPAAEPLKENAEQEVSAKADESPVACATALNAEPAPLAEPVQSDPFRPDMGWYVVHVYSGFEMKAKRALEERIRTHNLQQFFGTVMVPQETVIELVRGQKKTLNKKFYPGYMLVQMVMNEDTWHVVKETPKVTGFVGDVKDPAPLTEDEVRRLIGQIEQGAASPRSRMSFEQGETVKVIDGPFTEFNGTVEEVKPEKGKVRVLISIFGRATPVELDFVQVEKLA